MGCCSSGQVGKQVGSAARKEPLPSALAKAPQGRFASQPPQWEEGRRDFARIFFADQRKIFFLGPNMNSIMPLQPTGGPSSAHIGDLNEQVVDKAVSLFTESLVAQLEQALGATPKQELVDTLVKRAIAAMSVNVGIDFATTMQLMPTFFQPLFLVAVRVDSGNVCEARAATYGFVAEKHTQVVGDRPESKRTPFCVRLLSPDLMSNTVEKSWAVEYSMREIRTATIRQAVEADMEKLRKSLCTGRWDDN
eukprot:gb/GFBE01002760.1/.p1 GENE.gb/GFBE01002760.1/~~gb/GFBE01002760.1/.p1  ORF type:complete len:250 (+),score=43.43 gb/GFBE01002760.1/:1-750(+)